MAGASGITTVCKTEPQLKEQKTDLKITGETYAVEKIVGIKTLESGEKLYKVRWKGFDESEDTWEPYTNLTNDCDRLILQYESSQKSKDDENGEHSRASTSRSNEASENSSERSNSRHTHTGHWEYETVEVLTPDEWNRFGDVENRELGGLYIPDRIPTETEKLLCNLAPDLGRVTRNKLKAVMKTEKSPSKEPSPAISAIKGAGRGRGRNAKAIVASTSTKRPINDALRSVIKEESKAHEKSKSAEEQPEEPSQSRPTFAETVLTAKTDLPDDVLLSQLSGGALQIAAADTSTEDDGHFQAPAQPSRTESRRGSAKRGARGARGGRGRQRGKKSSTPTGSNEDAVSTASLEVRSVTTEVAEKISDLVVDEREPEATGGEEVEAEAIDGEEIEERTSPGRKSASPPVSRRGRTRNRGASATANRGRRSTTPRRTKLVESGEESAAAKPTKSRKRKASTNADNTAEEGESGAERIQKRKRRLSSASTADVFAAGNEPDEPEPEEPKPDYSALEVLACETPELPIPLTSASIPAIEIATIRRNQQNREKPLQTFEQFRNAVLSNHLSVVKWTGRVVPERRSFDFNQKCRGKTVAIELCERPCGPAHEIDDMLRQIVRDGARLDIPDDTRGRIPLHFAISCEFWCRVRTLLQLRSPVNTQDKDKKTPLHLALLTRNPSFEATRTIYLLLEYGADVNEVIRKMEPLRNRYLPNLKEHQHRLWQAFNDARVQTLVDITVKRTLLPVTVRAMWEFESTDWTTEIGFNHETFQFPNDRYGYLILLAVFDHRSARNWRVRMWGESPFADVQMNDGPVESLTGIPKGFVYVTSLINGWNKLKIKFQPYVQKKKWLLMAQVLLIQLHKPAPYVPRPALEVAPESGTDWRHD